MTLMPVRFGVLLLAACAFAPPVSTAQSLGPDPGFGTGGVVIDPSIAYGNAVLVQPDGKILVGGHNFGDPGPAIARYLSNGSPDPMFTAPTLPLDFVRGLALQDDGRIVLAGQDDFEVFTVARLLEDGTPDSSFSGDGVVTTTFSSSDVAVAVAIQPDDKIVVAGYYFDNGFRAAVARYLTDGAPDPDFGTGGIVLGPSADAIFETTRVILDSQGRIVVNGKDQLIRFLPGGSPDPGFGIGGIVALTPGYIGQSIAAAADDAVLVVGNEPSNFAVVLERYTDAGVLDATFGAGGQVRFGSFLLHNEGKAAIVLPDGRFYLAARWTGGFFLGRFLEDGSFDPTFGVNGFLLKTIQDLADPRDLAIQSDGAVILAGASTPELADFDVTLARYAACGPLSQPPPTITSVVPAELSAGGYELVQISGTGIDPTAAIRVGDAAARFVNLPAPGTIEVETFSHPLGLADVVVRNTDCQTAILSDAVFLYPTDVPPPDTYYPFVKRLIVNEVTAGCSHLTYCPDDPVTRAQMAVFLLTSKEGPTYQPPPATGTVFTDVAIDDFAAAWIEELSHRGITAGCDVNLYCPDAFNTRAQMAVFLLVTLEGMGYQPPDPTGIFADVPVSSPYARWIEEIFERGITAGCDANLFCPDDAVLREQMAVFLSATFNLPG